MSNVTTFQPHRPPSLPLPRFATGVGTRRHFHARYYWLLLAESHLTRRLFGAMLRRIWALPVPTG